MSIDSVAFPKRLVLGHLSRLTRLCCFDLASGYALEFPGKLSVGRKALENVAKSLVG